MTLQAERRSNSGDVLPMISIFFVVSRLKIGILYEGQKSKLREQKN